MKARFIRGEDPKAEIGIGNKIVQLANRMEMGARIICRDYNLDLSTIKKEVNERGISVEFDGLKPNLAHPYKYWMYYDKEREHFFVGYSEIATDQIGDQKPVESLEQAMLETRIYLNKYNWTAKGAKYESVNFERGIEPVDAMKLGDVTGRKMKIAYKQIKEAINKMAVEWWGNEEILTQAYNSYMRIKEKVNPEYIEVGIENQVGESTYFYYLVYVPDPDENLTNWAAGYKINHKSKNSYSPNVKTDEQDEIPYDTLEDAINKMEWWYKNL
jgi:DNA-directed RNA polymerase subunit L